MTDAAHRSDLGPLWSSVLGLALGVVAVAVGWVGGVLFLRLETAPFIRVLDVFVEAGLGVLAGLAVSRVRAQAWYLGWTAVGVAVIGSFVIAQELTIFARSGPMIFIFGAWVGTTWALNNRRESSG